ncbi:hypothetical protein QFZ22_009806 [Streptomyces canus]|uniref:Helix-turn-helix domain-containing protein n=1 Tax=Streptomyces canus TaxID=58343 RepID=A0AAW8FV62_9ACTN|nr:hypothetical protein [Streptomyces canus]MDQ0913734.1 hypothetical protein [Streptomyces canus]
MSMYPVLWAIDHAPVYDAEERAVLVALVVKGDFDGMNCFRSYPTLAAAARVDAKTAGRKCRAMESRGILRRQTAHRSRTWLSIPKEQRPVIWEVMIPAEWWSAAQLESINEQRAGLGRPAITAENRPALAPAPPKKTRADKGVKRPQKAAPGTTSPRGKTDTEAGGVGTTSPYPPDYKSLPPGLQVPQPSQSPSESPSEKLSPPPSVREAEVARASGSVTEGRTDSGVGIEDQEQGPGERQWTPGERLLERIGRHYPEIGAGLAQGTTLRDQARLVDGLLLSGVSQEQVRAVLVDRPYPAPAERKRSMAALIAARLTKIVPPLGLEAMRQVPTQAPAPEEGGPARTVELHLTRRPECPECGLDSPSGELCGACQGWPLCEGGCKRRVREGGLCRSCAVAPPEDDDADHVGTCPGFDGQRCGRPVATEGLCPRCQVRAAAAKKARDAQWAAQVAAVTAMTDEERQAATGAPAPF